MNVTVREYLDQLYGTYVHCMGHRPAQMRISPELYARYSNELRPNQRFVTGVSDGSTIQEGLLFRGTAIIEDPNLRNIQVNWRALSTSTTADNSMFSYLESRGMIRRVAGTEISVPLEHRRNDEDTTPGEGRGTGIDSERTLAD